MKMNGTRQISAPQQVVWEKLNDVDVLQRCIPGCQSLEKVSDTDLKAVVALKIGPISARFNGDVQLSDLDPPRAYRISGSGKAGPAGAATGSADVRLAPNGSGTELSYDVDATVSGKIAQLGARLIDSTAARLADQFFTNFQAEVEGPTPAQPSAPGPSAALPAANRNTTLMIVAAAVAAVAAIAYLLASGG